LLCFVNSYMRSLLLISFVCLSLIGKAQQQSDEIRKSIYFGGGSYYITEEQVNSLFQWLDSIPNLLDKYNIQLISHTDPIGGKEYNEWLSQMRSLAVEGILIQKPIPEHKISIKDWGLENPVYSNNSWQGMEMNRRVDVILYPIIF
jgi:outer membrane protein OmpA-like peptidoglycan-associated protein